MIRWRWVVLAGLLLLVIALLWGGSGSLGATSSSLSRAPGGWLGARLYLEAAGAEVQVLDQPLTKSSSLDGPAELDLLILSFPLQRALSSAEETRLFAYLRAGGNLLVAYSGAPLQFQEEGLLAGLGIELEQAREAPPLVPWHWWSYQQEEWLLEPDPAAFDRATGFGGDHDLRWRVPQMLAKPTRNSRALYRAVVEGREATPVVFEQQAQGGRVLVMPASLVSNARLLDPGHADLLNSLKSHYGPRIAFDEYHHGLVSASQVADPLPGITWNLLLIHLGLFYVFGWLALARRFGPPWREPPPVSGSAATFLSHLGAFHGHLGHHQAAAGLMVERLEKLDPGLELPDALIREGQQVDSNGKLVRFARHIAQHQRPLALPRSQRPAVARTR